MGLIKVRKYKYDHTEMEIKLGDFGELWLNPDYIVQITGLDILNFYNVVVGVTGQSHLIDEPDRVLLTDEVDKRLAATERGASPGN